MRISTTARMSLVTPASRYIWQPRRKMSSARCTLARFSEAFLILKGIEIGLNEALSPLTLALFNLAYVVLAYPAGALSDRMRPRHILMAGMAVLVAGDLILAKADNYALLFVGVFLHFGFFIPILWIIGALIAPTQRAAARAAPSGA